MAAVAVVLGTVLLLDVLRVWLPSIITIFGQAASTPPEQLAGFGLVWFLAGLLAPSVARRLGPSEERSVAKSRSAGGRWPGPVRLAVAAAVLLAAARLALPLTGGGQAQLYVACAGVVAGLFWLCGTAMAGASPLAGLAGLGAAAALHAALSTVDLTWRSGVVAWLLLAAEAAAFLALQVRAARSGPDGGAGPPRRGWFLFGPAAMLCGAWAVSPALAGAAVSHWSGRLADLPHAGATPGPAGAAATAALTATAVLGLAAGAVAVPRRRSAVAVAAAVLVAGAAAFGANATVAMPVAIPLGAVALGACVATVANAPTTRGRAGYAAVGGMIVFAVAAVAFYAAYDAGYPNWWVPPAVALAVAVPALLVTRPRPATAPRSPAVGAAALATVLAAAGVWWTPPAADVDAAVPGEVRLVAYNIRMGFGLAGRYDPDALAGEIAAQRPDVVVLGEVDRAWLLNGGHDTLDALARRLDMRYLFGPAADQVWGDAVLTRLPVLAARSVPLPAAGAPTGAQALGVRLDTGNGRAVTVVGTHLQPPPGGPPLAQARALVRFAEEFRAGGPAVIAGDLNVEPDTETFRVLTGAGYVDALAGARPLPTSPADEPRDEIDHVLVSRGLTGAEAVAPRTENSDHLPVAVTVRAGG